MPSAAFNPRHAATPAPRPQSPTIRCAVAAHAWPQTPDIATLIHQLRTAAPATAPR
ncbi:hypothetical protein [Kitasatospora sp. NPDC058478]|uniref:hypothetical protein n=1 Tax=unclassified Kitasatospora TaxID=2633591 RepID=UPI00364CDB19